MFKYVAIADRLRTVTATQLVWLNQFTGPKRPINHKSYAIKMDTSKIL